MNKTHLYKNIMKNVAKEVKRTLNENGYFYDNFDSMNSIEYPDHEKIYLKYCESIAGRLIVAAGSGGGLWFANIEDLIQHRNLIPESIEDILKNRTKYDERLKEFLKDIREMIKCTGITHSGKHFMINELTLLNYDPYTGEAIDWQKIHDELSTLEFGKDVARLPFIINYAKQMYGHFDQTNKYPYEHSQYAE